MTSAIYSSTRLRVVESRALIQHVTVKHVLPDCVYDVLQWALGIAQPHQGLCGPNPTLIAKRRGEQKRVSWTKGWGAPKLPFFLVWLWDTKVQGNETTTNRCPLRFLAGNFGTFAASLRRPPNEKAALWTAKGPANTSTSLKCQCGALTWGQY